MTSAYVFWKLGMRFRDPKTTGERIKGTRSVWEPEAGNGRWKRGTSRESIRA